MSADGDTVRDDLTDVKAWTFYYAPEPLKSKLERVLARLEAAIGEAEAGIEARDRSIAAMDVNLEACMTQRDALARKLTDLGYDVDQILSEGS